MARRRDAYGNARDLRLWDGGSAEGEEGRGPRSGPVSRASAGGAEARFRAAPGAGGEGKPRTRVKEAGRGKGPAQRAQFSAALGPPPLSVH
jgi:hypothetical protein